MKNCQEDEVVIEFQIRTNSRKKITAHSFNLGDTDFIFEVNGEKRSTSETFKFNKRKPLQLTLRYKRNHDKKQDVLKFKTDSQEYLDNSITIDYGIYIITSEEIRKRKKQIINISESCSDRIKISFPYGGTVSSATVYKDSVQSIDASYKHTTYKIMDKNNFLIFSKSDIGIYGVSYGSCHWGNDFVLQIK
ncbi:hypothetical protein [Kordia sp.]|uniref:hypothetical protein n=1 Tax=Kordia sp. TaxID=1965332 RepID=UPI003B592DAF